MKSNSSASDISPAVCLRNSSPYGSTSPTSLTRSTETRLEFVVSRSGSGDDRARVSGGGGVEGGQEGSSRAKKRRRW